MTFRPLLVAASLTGSLLLTAPAVRAQSEVVEPAPPPVTVVEGLDFPAGIAFDVTGTMYVSERPGRLLSITPAGERRMIGSIPTITEGETGLLGIAVSPDQRDVYGFATEQDGTNTIWRFPISGQQPQRFIKGLPGATYHNGGGVAFGADGMLYVSNGETHTTNIAQDPSVLGGKVYRYTPEGTVPDDNPFGDSPAYSLGHRNPFGLAIDPVSGDPFVTENGPESHDEINRIVAGGNGGWPVTSGRAEQIDTSALRGRYQDPLLQYPEVIVPTGITFAPEDAGTPYAGDLFFGAYGEQTIHRVTLNRARDRAVEDEIFYRSREPIVAVAWGPRGLYLSTPAAVKLIPLTEEDDGSGSSSARDRASAPEEEGSSGPIAFVLFSIAGLVLAGALVYAFRPKRRGRA